MMKEFYRPDEIAQILKISKAKVYELINDINNPLPSKLIGGQLRIPENEFKKYLKKCDNKTYL